MNRLGRALSYIYDDTVQASLPPRLQMLVDRLQKPSHVGDQPQDSGK